MAIREGAWDCPHCGRTRNRGPRKFCAGCGAPRGEGVPFYLPDDARVVTDAAEIARAKAGPDWVCVHCEGDNPADAPFCSGCGASRDGAPRREVVEHRYDAPPPPPQPAAAPAPAKTSGCRRRVGCYGCGCLTIFLLLLIAIGLNAPPSYNTGDQSVESVDTQRLRTDAPRETVLTVAEVQWERSIDVEALRTFTESAWEGEVPDGVRVLGSSREVHHTEQVRTGSRTKVRTWTERVQTGTEKVRDGTDRVQVDTERVKVGVRDLGNGYFEDIYEDRPVYENRPRYEDRPVYREVERRETYQEPVYQDRPVYRRRVRYEVDRWTTVRTVDASGKDHSPAWPDAQLGRREQEGSRRESYTVVLRAAAGKTFTHKPATEAEWHGFAVGSTYKASLSPEGELVKLGDLVATPPPPEPSPSPSSNDPTDPAERTDPSDPTG